MVSASAEASSSVPYWAHGVKFVHGQLVHRSGTGLIPSHMFFVNPVMLVHDCFHLLHAVGFQQIQNMASQNMICHFTSGLIVASSVLFIRTLPYAKLPSAFLTITTSVVFLFVSILLRMTALCSARSWYRVMPLFNEQHCETRNCRSRILMLCFSSLGEQKMIVRPVFGTNLPVHRLLSSSLTESNPIRDSVLWLS